MDAAAPATNPFLDATQPTMAQLIAIIQADGQLAAARRANVASSIRRFCAALGYEPDQVPANHWYFRRRLERFHPLSAGIAVKRWATIKADIGFALRHAGLVEGKGRGFAPHTVEWLALKERLPGTMFDWGFTRFARFCGGKDISPAGVTDAVIGEFRSALERETFKTKPASVIRQLCVRWNKAAMLAADLGIKAVTVPSQRDTYTQPWDDLPERFRRDVDAWLETMSQEADLLSDVGPIKALRPASIRTYRYNLRQAFAAFIASSDVPHDLVSLAMLVEPANAKSILKFFLDRSGRQKTSMIAGIAHVLFLAASTRGGVAQEALDQLRRYRKQMTERRPGLRPRPREALRPFADPENIKKVLMLPLQIHERLRKKPELDRNDALLMQAAIELELLLMRPIRRQNLAELRIGETLVRSGREMFVVLPSEQVKNAQELDYRIPRESVVLIDFYLKRAIPMLGGSPDGWLFPGAIAGRHKTPDQLYHNFRNTIRRETGLTLYIHLMRHFGARLYLKENPGAFEVVRRVLGHKSLTTTTTSYVSFDDETAVAMFDKLVLRIRDSIQAEING